MDATDEARVIAELERNFEAGERVFPVLGAIERLNSPVPQPPTVAPPFAIEVHAHSRADHAASVERTYYELLRGLSEAQWQRSVRFIENVRPQRITWVHKESLSGVHPRETAITALSRLYRWLWVVLGLLDFLWGAIASASFFGDVGVAHSTAIYGSLILFGLMATLFAAGRQRERSGRKK